VLAKTGELPRAKKLAASARDLFGALEGLEA